MHDSDQDEEAVSPIIVQKEEKEVVQFVRGQVMLNGGFGWGVIDLGPHRYSDTATVLSPEKLSEGAIKVVYKAGFMPHSRVCLTGRQVEVGGRAMAAKAVRDDIAIAMAQQRDDPENISWSRQVIIEGENFASLILRGMAEDFIKHAQFLGAEKEIACMFIGRNICSAC